MEHLLGVADGEPDQFIYRGRNIFEMTDDELVQFLEYKIVGFSFRYSKLFIDIHQGGTIALSAKELDIPGGSILINHDGFFGQETRSVTKNLKMIAQAIHSPFSSVSDAQEISRGIYQRILNLVASQSTGPISFLFDRLHR